MKNSPCRLFGKLVNPTAFTLMQKLDELIVTGKLNQATAEEFALRACACAARSNYPTMLEEGYRDSPKVVQLYIDNNRPKETAPLFDHVVR